MKERQNILLLTVDDMNYNSLGCYGNPMKDVTPNLDKLASQGMIFSHSHVTIAVCQPSRSALLTGKYPHHNGARGFQDIDASTTTLTEVLSKNGYFNGIIGKETHCAPRNKFFWDIYVRTYCDELGMGRNPEVYYEETKKLIKQAKDEGKPFFAMVNSHDPHRPFADSDDEAAVFGKHWPVPKKFDPNDVFIPGCLPDLPGVREELAQYYASCHRADLSMGRVLDALDESGERENTLIVFISDNGMALPFAKTNCYLNSTRTPCIVSWPGKIEPGSKSEALISGIDFTPTILELVGLSPIIDVDGKSVQKALATGGEHYDDIFTLFFRTAKNSITLRELDFPMRCVQNKRFAYIFNAWSDGEYEFRNDSREGLTFNAMREAAKTDSEIAARVEHYLYRCTEELYDYHADPNALNNLIDDPDYAGQVAELRERMIAYMKESKDTLIDYYYRRVIKSEDFGPHIEHEQ